MALSHRPMQPKDVRECVDIIAKHPVIGPRYGCAIHDLHAAWVRLLSCDAKNATVFREQKDGSGPIWFVGISLFVGDDFVRELKAHPQFWFGPELARRIARGDYPMVSERELRDANSRGGLNLLVWEGCARPEFETQPDLPRYVISAFLQEHRGYRWKELISSQLESVARPHAPKHRDFCISVCFVNRCACRTRLACRSCRPAAPRGHTRSPETSNRFSIRARA